MSELQEYEWLLILLKDLKNNYKDHHSGVLEQLISIIEYRLKCLSGKSK